ncbi:hypothetical protein FRC12_017655 [Ceratobasidium sp. 428]|nr:hypothetical protein FRC12_017655 [Ceratobasidium sp. 428]
MGQNRSQPVAPESPTQRPVVKNTSFNRRRASGSAGYATSQRSSRWTAPATINAAHRANNVASPPPYGDNAQTQGFTPTGEAEQSATSSKALAGMENALELLKEYDTVFLIDDSGSMAGSLWREAGEALEGVARVAAQYDDDGIDIHFLNSRESLIGAQVGQTITYGCIDSSHLTLNKNETQIRELFARIHPRGQTPTGARLDSLLRSYVASIERAYKATSSTDSSITGIKPVNFIVITDGAPTDEPEDVIVAVARRLDRGDFPLSQLGVQFVQIGNDPEAKAALEELDDDLSEKYGIRDIVDTTPYPEGGLNGETLIKILLGGINRRVDKRGGISVIR